MILIILFLAFLASCSSDFKHVQIADEVQNLYIDDVCRNRKYSVHMTGGAMMGDIQQFAIGFSSRGEKTVEECRIEYVELMERFLHLANNYKRVWPYLRDYPLTEKNFDLEIMCYDRKGKEVKRPYVNFVFMAKGRIVYCTPATDPDNLPDTLFEEDYEDAKRIYLEERGLCEPCVFEHVQ